MFNQSLESTKGRQWRKMSFCEDFLFWFSFSFDYLLNTKVPNNTGIADKVPVPAVLTIYLWRPGLPAAGWMFGSSCGRRGESLWRRDWRAVLLITSQSQILVFNITQPTWFWYGICLQGWKVKIVNYICFTWYYRTVLDWRRGHPRTSTHTWPTPAGSAGSRCRISPPRNSSSPPS